MEHRRRILGKRGEGGRGNRAFCSSSLLVPEKRLGREEEGSGRDSCSSGFSSVCYWCVHLRTCGLMVGDRTRQFLRRVMRRDAEEGNGYLFRRQSLCGVGDFRWIAGHGKVVLYLGRGWAYVIGSDWSQRRKILVGPLMDGYKYGKVVDD